VKRHSIPATANALGRHERRDDTDRREDKQVRPLEPAMHDPQVLGQGIGEDDDQESEQCDRQIGDQSIGCLTHIAFAFPDEPAGAEQGIAETEANAAQYCKGTEPAEFAPGVLAIGYRQPLHQGADSHPLHEGSDE
jgi:hypothetical protein